MSSGAAARATQIRRGLPIANGRGLEIGPLAKPLVAKAEGDILYADFLSTEELRAQHAASPFVDAARIAEVDIVLGREPLDVALAPHAPFDYVIASHVFEHLPNPVRWLQQLAASMNQGGLLSLAIPDKRYTFDYLRQPTRLSELIANYLDDVKFPTSVQALDNNLNVVKINAADAWRGAVDPEALENYFSPEVAIRYFEQTIKIGRFADCHCTVWTCEHFLSTIERLRADGWIEFEVVTSLPAAPMTDEFFAVLKLARR